MALATGVIDRTLQQIPRDSLYAGVGAVGAAPVGPGDDVPRGGSQALGPKDRRCVEHEIALWAGEDRGCVMPLARAARPDGTLREHLQPLASEVRFAMMLPTDEAGNALALFHSRPRKNPVLRFCTGPVATAVERHDASRADDIPLV
jgi:hypothetical protein